jgi:hypothetical protein
MNYSKVVTSERGIRSGDAYQGETWWRKVLASYKGQLDHFPS